MKTKEELRLESEQRKKDFYEVIEEKIDPKLEKMAENIQAEIRSLKNEMTDLRGDIEDLEKRVDTDMTRNALRHIEKDLHDRKWALIVSGIPAVVNETTSDTKAIISELGKNVWGKEINSFSACHRLSNNKDANIYVQFIELETRNLWLLNAKELKPYNIAHKSRISIYPDLPVPLRPLKDDIMDMRKKFLLEKKKCSIKYHQFFPFITLHVGPYDKKVEVKPNISADMIAHYYLYPEDNPRFKPRNRPGKK